MRSFRNTTLAAMLIALTTLPLLVVAALLCPNIAIASSKDETSS